MTAMRLYGVDFTSAPRRRKPITVACADVTDDPSDDGAAPLRITLRGIDRLVSFADWEAWLRTPGPWAAGFDFPFGFARDFAAAQDWPLDGPDAWARTMRTVGAMTRAELVDRCRAWCDARPAGDKFAHRATDRPAGSSPSMKWVNPPVVLMMHAGVPRLLEAGVDVPGLHAGDPQRVALEAYPGLLARQVLGRASYKSDDVARQDAPRRAMRERLADALQAGAPGWGVQLRWNDALRSACIDDPGGDLIDAVVCCVQAGWSWRRRDRRWGLPAHVDPIEGWIVGAASDFDADAATVPAADPA